MLKWDRGYLFIYQKRYVELSSFIHFEEFFYIIHNIKSLKNSRQQVFKLQIPIITVIYTGPYCLKYAN